MDFEALMVLCAVAMIMLAVAGILEIIELHRDNVEIKRLDKQYAEMKEKYEHQNKPLTRIDYRVGPEI